MNFEIPYHRPLGISFENIPMGHMLSNDEKVRELEHNIQLLYDTEYAIACSSCTQGLLISLLVMKELFKTDLDYVDTPAFAWYSSEWAIRTAGLDPFFLDIDPNTWLMEDYKRSEQHQWNLCVHTFGNSIFTSLADITLYDGAQSLGAKLEDIGIATVFSLAPTKLITACEGGIIITNDHDFATKVITLRDKVSRLSELNAMWGLETLEYLDEILDWKQQCYNYYKNHLPGQFQEIPHSSNYNVIGFLTDLKIPPEIETRKYYFPLQFGLKNTAYVYGKIICLPSWYGVDYELVVEKILGFNNK